MGAHDTVAQLVRQIERQHPARIAVEEPGGATVTVRELRDRSNRLANALGSLGVTQGDRVGYLSGNCPEYFEIDFALAKGGFTKVPLYTRLSAAEVLRLVELADVRVVLAEARWAETLVDEGAADRGVVVVALEAIRGLLGYDELLSRGSTRDPGVQPMGDHTYHIRFSSGSTGPPKGIAISHAGARAAMLGNLWIMTTQGVARAPRTLQQAPLVFAGGWSVIPTLLMGGTNVMARSFVAELMRDLLVAERIDWMFAVPTMLRRLAEVDHLDRLSDANLSCLMYAGEPAPLEALAILTQHTDALVQCWGQTEAPASTTFLSRAEHGDPALWPSIGRPIPGVEFGLLEDGATVRTENEAGVSAELVIRTPTVATELIGAEREHVERSLEGGWWRTGDIGRIDHEGRIFIEGRVSEVIISGGTNIHPSELENVLEQHPRVHEAIVVGVPDPRWGETPAALVSGPMLGAGDAQSVEAWMTDRLARFKRPGYVFLTRDPLPRQGVEAKPSRSLIRATLRGWIDGKPCPEGVVASHRDG